jgi:hypothetical protein
MKIITTKHNQQQHQQKKEQDNNNVVDNYYNNNNNRRTNKQTPRVCKLGCWMEDLRHTHPNLFIGQIDNAFHYSILHSMLVMERADQDMIDCAFNLMKKEMERHSENYRTLDDLLEEGGVDI